MSIQDSRNAFCNSLREMVATDQYFELMHYGDIKENLEFVTSENHYERILVIHYYGSMWFMHLEDGCIIKIEEV